MTDSDMEYVTRRDLREELAPMHAMMRHILETMERGFRLLTARIDQVEANARRDITEMRRDMITVVEQLGTDLRSELATQINASAEETRTWIGALDDKYRDLPARVTAVEERSAGPKRAARRRSPKRH